MEGGKIFVSFFIFLQNSLYICFNRNISILPPRTNINQKQTYNFGNFKAEMALFKYIACEMWRHILSLLQTVKKSNYYKRIEKNHKKCKEKALVSAF